MITNKFKEFEDYVILRLKYLKLQDDFKSLVISVSHDLSSPLHYFKFSTEILTSQVSKIPSGEIKETARVISSSSSKLNKQAKQIVEKAKLKIEHQLKSIPIKDILISSLDFYGYNLDENRLTGDLEAELTSDFYLNKYLVTSLVLVSSRHGVIINKISVENRQKMIFIKFNVNESEKDGFKKLNKVISELNEKEFFNSVAGYLKVKVILDKAKSKTTIDLVLFNKA